MRRMAADPITAIANALASAGSAARPFIEEHLAQKHESAHQKRMAEFVGILAVEDVGLRADRLHDFVLRLLAAAGSPARGVGAHVAVPVDVLMALVAEVSEGIKKDANLARVQFK